MKITPVFAHYATPRAGTYIEVENFDDLLRRVNGVDVVLPERTTFYGMREIHVRDLGWNIICFAAKSLAAG